MADFIEVRRENGVVTATLNNPADRNALTSPDQFRELTDLCAELEHDRSAKVLVLTGAGSAFCAGGNIKDMQDKAGIFEGSPYELRNRYRLGIQSITRALYDLEVPTIAAVNGPAIGAGMDLATMCDIRIGSPRAMFAQSFVKLGIVSGDGGAWLLPRVIGLPRATQMALTGAPVGAEQALAWGLINELVDESALLGRAQEIAAQIAANPIHAVRLTKRLLRESQDMKLAPLLELAAAYQALAHHTADHDEAVAAFIDRRSPVFNDR